jgi:hypothetical protein
MADSGTNGASRFGLWTGIVASAIVLLGAIGGVFYVAFQGQANTSSVNDIKLRIDRIEDRQNMADGKINSQADALVEIETQFCATDIVRNLMHANDMRIQSMLWAKAYPGSVLPTDNAYYPTICNRKSN